MKNLFITSEQIHEIYSLSYSVAESRGKLRQKKINENIINALKSSENYDGCVFDTEVRVKEKINYGEYFTVDAQVFKSGKLSEILLFKAPASNIKQNSVNSMNSKVGEVIRIAPLIETGVKLTFITLLPNKTPYFKDNGDIKSFEDNKIPNIDSVKKYISVDFSDIVITFNIEGIENTKNREEIKNLFLNKKIITNIKVCI
jgi:hypothetical protein